MKRLTTLTVLITTLVTAVFVGGGATAASATTTPQIVCEMEEEGNYSFSLWGSAQYVDDTSTGQRRWTSFTYELFGNAAPSTHNNVNITVSKLGAVAFHLDSPDNRKLRTTYKVTPDHPVYTSLRLPDGTRDHRTNHLVEMEAIFDLGGQADPKCTGWVFT